MLQFEFFRDVKHVKITDLEKQKGTYSTKSKVIMMESPLFVRSSIPHLVLYARQLFREFI